MRDTFLVRFLNWADVTLEYIELVNDRLQEQSMMNRLLKRSNLTTRVADASRFYNDSTSSLNNEDILSIEWSYLEKHTFEMASLFCRWLRMLIIKCWNFSPSPPRGFSTILCQSPKTLAGSSLSSSYEREMHTREVTELKARIDKVTELHE
ncbi:NBS-LRR type resistance protein [Cucumis melo var. makuwa]|uniref:NBS-LRR type resistance protein n=1 Tax=Cucumis melo var. makuwa TaxID=1194695 RepID=A0A5A7VEW2_CUCMM|nr:NBS-LRR type resistance protein [Cucumis melo var. makuwa]